MNTQTDIDFNLNIIKLALADKLEKMGSSLEEFELLLSQPGELEKIAEGNWLTSGIGDIFSGIKNMGELAILGSFLTGAAGGGLAYGLKSHLTEKNREIADKQQEIARINFLTKRLKAEHGLN